MAELPPQTIVQKHTEDGYPHYQIWCAPHDRHPSECFDLHHPEPIHRPLDRGGLRQDIAQSHLDLQRAAKAQADVGRPAGDWELWVDYNDGQGPVMVRSYSDRVIAQGVADLLPEAFKATVAPAPRP